MSKNAQPASGAHVTWHLHGDAIRPKEAPWGFVVQNPVQRVIPPGQSIVIDTGVAASTPMFVWPRGDQGDYVTVQALIWAGQTITVKVENKSKHSALVIDDREALVNVHPLTWSGTSSESDA
jgi:hypothetical protein